MDTDETVTLRTTPTNASSTTDNTTDPDTPTEAILEAAVTEMTDKTPDSLTQQNDETVTDAGGVAATIAKTFSKGIAILKRRHSKTPEIEDKTNGQRSPSEEEAYEATQRLLEREKQARKKKRQEERELLKKEKEDMEKERLRQKQEKEFQERKKQLEKERKEQEEKTRRDNDIRKRQEITDYYKQTDRWSPTTATRVTTADTQMLDAIYAGLRDMKSADRLMMNQPYDKDTFMKPPTDETGPLSFEAAAIQSFGSRQGRQTSRNQPRSPPAEDLQGKKPTNWG